MRLTKAIHVPSGLQLMLLIPSFIEAIVRTSPGPSIGSTCRVDSPLFSLRLETKAMQRPSGDQLGWVSLLSPLLSGRGGVDPSAAATHTWARARFFVKSTLLTTKTICVPSGDTFGDEAATTPPMIRSAISACLLGVGFGVTASLLIRITVTAVVGP